jgi:serine protease Do
MLVGDLDAASTQRQLQIGAVEPVENSLGLSVSELTEDDKQRLGLDHGLRVDEITGQVAQRAGLQEGDILLSLNGRDLESLSDLAEIDASLPVDSPLPLLVERDGQQSFFTLMLDG